ncbi:ubinuclein-2-like isoform X2 [Silene latifolia]|uniref:ubinuclein-2-like isoform X2 n=1 Tax=Silene latifolia TaxID=37657 RepID=UPI003D76C8B3
MTEGAGTSAVTGGETTPSPATARTATSEKVGDRMRFTVEIRPGETTIVSWKKLMKDAAKAEGGGTSATAAVTAEVTAATAAVPALEARLAPVQPAANEDPPAPNRFSAVIEKIERLYKGKDSSDEEDLNDVPDDDQYDTEDSFIDDAELDEYFQVDKSKTKHDGYFVNKGILEKVVEPTESANPQPNKRRRKDVAKAAGSSDDGQGPRKRMKEGNKGTGKSLLSEKGVLHTSEGPIAKCSSESKFQNHHKIVANDKPLLDSSLRISHDDGSLTLAQISEKQKIGSFPAKKTSSKLKESRGNGDRTESIHNSHSLINDSGETKIVLHQKDNSVMRERIDLNLPDTKHSIQPVKNPVMHKKEISSGKSKANVLEKAIRDLEKSVAESRPPAVDALDGDSSSPYIKRRLPREIMQKLAKVARLAHASNGTVSNELLSRLMGFLGHLCQVRTLKRHLKVMVTTSLSAKQEKDDKFQLIKKEVVEMVKTSVPSLISKATEQQSGGSVDLQVSSHAEKAAKSQQFMDPTLEDKICDLYDIFVDGLDEDAAPQVRKLYAELAQLWPKGVMDNHGIKRAICRAKERKRTLDDKNKEQEKIKRKKVIATNPENIVPMEHNSATQSQYMDVKPAINPDSTALTHHNQFSSIAPAITSSTNGPNSNKVKGTNTNSHSDARIVDSMGMNVKKKVKKRSESSGRKVDLHPEKFSPYQEQDKLKQQEHPAVSHQN